MIRSDFKIFAIGCLLSLGIFSASCKSKPKDQSNSQDTASVTAPVAVSPAPVQIASDTALQRGVRDATKDYPGVKADVNDGEITLTGQIERRKLADLMMSLNSLKPKKVNNQLTIK